MPDAVTGTVESVDAEVAKVVELVMDHAVKRPRESLMVITASARHAARVHQAVLAAFAKRTDLLGLHPARTAPSRSRCSPSSRPSRRAATG